MFRVNLLKILEREFFFYTNLSIAKTRHLHITGRHLIASFIFMTELWISPIEKDTNKKNQNFYFHFCTKNTCTVLSFHLMCNLSIKSLSYVGVVTFSFSRINDTITKKCESVHWRRSMVLQILPREQELEQGWRVQESLWGGRGGTHIPGQMRLQQPLHLRLASLQKSKHL